MIKVVITGAKGMLGQDLSKILTEEKFLPIETDIHNMDITNYDEVRKVLEEKKPDFIIHGAAYTNVDGAQSDAETAFLINKDGTSNIAKASAEIGIPIVYISTDYVFDGTKNKPYLPKDKTCPINIYGESKLAGELAVQSLNPKHYIVRTSWLYGHNGKNFVETMINLASKQKELRVINDQVGCPTWSIELAKAIVNVIKNNKPYGIYHVCGSGFTSWHGFAEKIMELSGLDVKVVPVATEEFPTPARRPQYSIMENNGICPDWQISLENYIKLRKECKTEIKL